MSISKFEQTQLNSTSSESVGLINHHHHSGTNNTKKIQVLKYIVYVTTLLLLFIGSLSIYNQTSSSNIEKSSEVNIDEILQPTKRIFFSDIDDDTYELIFKSYIDKYSKQYDNDLEYFERYENFKISLSLADERNANEEANGGSAIHGITFFSDRSDDEKKLLRGYIDEDLSKDNSGEPISYIPSKYNGPYVSVDWTGVYTTDIKDQGYCGSCWAFSVTEQIEADANRVLGYSEELSPQQIVSCDKVDKGCNGGKTERAYMYVKSAGLSTSSDYEYEDVVKLDIPCKDEEIDPIITISNYASLKDSSVDKETIESRMFDYVMSVGPLSVCLDASSWDTYISGVVSTCSTSIDHCVQVVGMNTITNAWKVRNSWGLNFGDSGFIWLKYGQNTCGLTHDPTFSIPIYYESD